MPRPMPHLQNGEATTTNGDTPLEFVGDRLMDILHWFHFTSFPSLQELMAASGAVISGSVALSLLFPYKFSANDVDFYVLPFGFPAVLKYVQEHGYDIVPHKPFSTTYGRDQLVVVKLVHPISEKSINVITAIENHVVDIIARFHSTIVMNYVAWFGLVVLYPEWTLKKCGLVINDTPGTAECLTKYSERGFDLYREIRDLPVSVEVHVCRGDPYCSVTVRSLHDGHSFVEPFDPQGFDLKEVEEDAKWILAKPCPLDNVEDGEMIVTA